LERPCRPRSPPPDAEEEDFDDFAVAAPDDRPCPAPELFVAVFFAWLWPPLRLDEPPPDERAVAEPELRFADFRPPPDERVLPFFFAAIAVSK